MQKLRIYLVSLFDHRGRFGRLELLLALLAINLCFFLLGAVVPLILGEGGIVFMGLSLVGLYVNSCNAIKRMHDLGSEPWILLLILVPPINIALLAYLFFFPGKKPDPGA